MSKVTLELYEALELFGYLMAKADGPNEAFTLSDLYRTAFLEKKLSDYKSKPRAEALSNRIFGKKRNSALDKHPQAVYELARKIRQSEPVIIDMANLIDFQKFINDDIEPVFHYKLPEGKKIPFWSSNQVFDTFVNTKWWIYFKDRKNNSAEHSNLYSEGITRALLIMHPFGKVEALSYNVDTEEAEEYVGSYKMYGDNDFVQMNMYLKGTQTRDLHILIYTGKSKVSFALGQFHNVGRYIYSGTLALERIDRELTDREAVAPGKFYDRNASEEIKSEVPSQAWLFFAERYKNIIKTPCKIANKTDFNKWHREKNPRFI